MPVVITAFIPQDGLFEITEKEPVGVSLDGLDMRIEGSHEIGSGLPHDLDDLDVHVALVNASGTKRIPLAEHSGLKLPSGGKLLVDHDIVVFLPSFYAIFQDPVDRPGSEPMLEISASGRYMGGAMTMDFDTRIGLKITEDCERITANGFVVVCAWWPPRTSYPRRDRCSWKPSGS